MKSKTLVSGCLVGMVVLFLVHEYSAAQSNASAPVSKIAVVHVERALQSCKATAQFREKTAAESSKMDAEEEQLSNEVQALRAGLRALVPNSSDWLAQYKEMRQKENELKTLQEFNPQLRALKAHQWTEKVYPEMLRITQELAAKKGLALVLAVDEPEFPMPRAEELAMRVRTHKVLYSGGCLDLTDEVVTELDKMDSLLVK